MNYKNSIAVLLVALVAVTLVNLLSANSGTTPLIPLSPVAQPTNALYRFAVIGDYGNDSAAEARVSALVAGWNPDFVITTGDNNYPSGAANTIDRNIGKYYSSFIGNYNGQYGPGSPTNRFWPSLGNHDWYAIGCGAAGCSGPYLDYFSLPGNERYYDVDYGVVHLYALDSYGQEPDDVTYDSTQGNWLQSVLASSSACYDLVFFHHPPYSSGNHGSDKKMRWPFAAWGADIVLSGHEHSYERLDVAGMPYFVNGIGGKSLYNFAHVGDIPAGVVSVIRYNEKNGAMLITVTDIALISQLFDIDGNLIDEYEMEKDCEDLATTTPTATSSQTPTATTMPTATSSQTPTATPTSVSATPLATAEPTPIMIQYLYLPGVVGTGNP